MTLLHTDMNEVPQSSYKLGDFIKFDMSFERDIPNTKARLQECWATSNGVDNKYNLITNRLENYS